MERFNLLGTTIEFPEEVMTYSKIYQYYFNAAVTISEVFEEDYYKLTGVSEYRDNINEVIVFPRIIQTIELLVNQLVGVGVYDVSVNRVVAEFGEYILEPWCNAYDEIEDQFLRLEMDENQVNFERKLRKENRGRLIGGGFGLSGAAKGIATAAAFNTATGAFHGLANVMGSRITGFKNNLKAYQILRKEETFSTLKQGLMTSIISLHTLHCHYAGFDMSTLPFDEMRASAITDNYLNIPKDNRKNALCECFKFNPFFFRTYQLALAEFGDANNELDILANAFGVKVYLDEYKEALLNTMVESPANITSKDANKIRNQLQNKMKYLGIADSPKMQELTRTICELDLTERTVKGVVYPSLEEAQAAKKDKEYCEQILLRCSNCTSPKELEELFATVEKNCKTKAIIVETQITIKARLADVWLNTGNYVFAETNYNEVKRIIKLNCVESEWQSFVKDIDKKIIHVRCQQVSDNDYSESNINRVQNIMDSIERDFPGVYYEKKEHLVEMCETYYYLKMAEKTGLDGITVLGEEEFSEKLKNATKEYAENAWAEVPFVVYDSTVFQSAKEGFVLTNKTLYVNNGNHCEKKAIPVNKIKGFSYKKHFPAYRLFCITDNESLLIIYCNNAKEADRYIEFLQKLIKGNKINNKNILENVRENINQTNKQSNASEISKLSESELKDKALKLKSMYKLTCVDPVGTKDFESKIIKAKEAYAEYQATERSFLLYDISFSGAAKDGYVITDKNIYFNNREHVKAVVPLNKIKKTYYKKSFVGYDFYISTDKGDYYLQHCGSDKDGENCKAFFLHLMEINSIDYTSNEKSEGKKKMEIASDLVFKYKFLNVYLSGTKPFEKKISKAKSTYANDVSDGSIIVLHDSTVLGSAKEGFILTDKNIYINNSKSKKKVFPFNQINRIYSEESGLLFSVFINTKEGNFEVTSCTSEDEANRFKDFLSVLMK